MAYSPGMGRVLLSGFRDMIAFGAETTLWAMVAVTAYRQWGWLASILAAAAVVALSGVLLAPRSLNRLRLGARVVVCLAIGAGTAAMAGFSTSVGIAALVPSGVAAAMQPFESVSMVRPRDDVY